MFLNLHGVFVPCRRARSLPHMTFFLVLSYERPDNFSVERRISFRVLERRYEFLCTKGFLNSYFESPVVKHCFLLIMNIIPLHNRQCFTCERYPRGEYKHSPGAVSLLRTRLVALLRTHLLRQNRNITHSPTMSYSPTSGRSAYFSSKGFS